MSRAGEQEVRAWLAGRPSLEELRERFPGEYEVVLDELAPVLREGDPAALQEYVLGLSTATTTQLVRRDIAAAVVRKVSLATAAGVGSGTIRLGKVNGAVAQRLLFEEGLRRKAVSNRAFGLLWPMLWQRRRLMPLVNARGIYCFYSRGLVRELVGLIDGRRCLEIAAGDGTLSRLLGEAGTEVLATDDASWAHTIDIPEAVVRQDATEALRSRRPEVVLCSWPPAANPFEAAVFRTPSVQLYVVITSAHEFAAGAWDAYRGQTGFGLERRPDLARLVLPPEIDPEVLVFTRRAAA